MPLPFQDPITPASQKESPPKPSAFDVLTRLLLPTLTLVALIIAQLQQQQSLFWWLLGFTLLLLVIGFYRSTLEYLRSRIRKFRDKRLAKQRFPDFKRFVHRFGEFLDISRSDTLHRIAHQELSSSNSIDFERLRVVPLDLFNSIFCHLRIRVDKQVPNLSDFVDFIAEFSTFVNQYEQYCTIPIFERFAEDLRAQLKEGSKSSLNDFQLRFSVFLMDYSEYLKKLNASLSTPRIEWYEFDRPKSL